MEWLTLNEVAEFSNVHESTILRKIKKGVYGPEWVGYRYNKNRYGKYIEINIDYLPEDVKNKYLYGSSPFDIVPDTAEFEAHQKKQAQMKASIVKRFRRSGMSGTDFIAEYNEKNGTDFSAQQLWRWQRKHARGGVDALIDNRGGYNRGYTSIDKDVWEYFCNLYLTQQQRGIKLCHDMTKKKFENIPHVSTFERAVAKLPRFTIIKYRYGEHALEDYLPSMERSKTDIFSNDIWFSDHHIIDVFVKSSTGKRIKRLWLTVFFDARSNKVISFTAREAYPDADVIKQTLRKGIEECGVPKELYFDNGKDYRSKAFNPDISLSLASKLGIKMIYAKPYHGQAKTVERFFKTFEERFCKLFPTYTGKDAKNRPECMKISNDKILALAPEKDDFIAHLNAYIQDYNNTVSKGADMENSTPNEIYQKYLHELRKMPDCAEVFLLFGKTEKRTVHKNGITVFNNTYWGDGLIPHFGNEVNVCFDQMNLSRAYVYDNKGDYICTVYSQIRTPFRHTTAEDYKEAERRRQLVKKMVKEYEPQLNIDIYSEIAKQQLEEKQHTEEIGQVYNTNYAEKTPGDAKKKSEKRTSRENDFALIGFEKFRKLGGE